jgi:hypothetical protein
VFLSIQHKIKKFNNESSTHIKSMKYRFKENNTYYEVSEKIPWRANNILNVFYKIFKKSLAQNINKSINNVYKDIVKSPYFLEHKKYQSYFIDMFNREVYYIRQYGYYHSKQYGFITLEGLIITSK